MSLKSGVGKSLAGSRGAAGGIDIKALLGGPGGSGLALTNVAITGLTAYSGMADDVALGNVSPASGRFTYVEIGAADGTGGSFTAYGNKGETKVYDKDGNVLSVSPGDSLNWDPTTAILNIMGGLKIRDPSQFGNITIHDNIIEAVNADGNVELKPQSRLGQIQLNGNIVQNRPGVVELASATHILLESKSDVNLSSRDNTIVTTERGDVIITTDVETEHDLVNIIYQQRNFRTERETALDEFGNTIETVTTYDQVFTNDKLQLIKRTTANGSETLVEITTKTKSHLTDGSTSTLIDLETTVVTPATDLDPEVRQTYKESSVSVEEGPFTPLSHADEITHAALFTTQTPHKFQAGEIVDVKGTNTDPSYDGKITVGDVLTPTTFSVQRTGELARNGTGGNLSVEKNGAVNIYAAKEISFLVDVPIVFRERGKETEIEWKRLPQIEAETRDILSFTSAYVKSRDPILTLTPPEGTPRDRFSDSGIAVEYTDPQGKVRAGFFGFVNSTKDFTWIPDAKIVRNQDGSKDVSGEQGTMSLSGLKVAELTGNPNLKLNTPSGSIILNSRDPVSFQSALDFGNAGQIKPTPTGLSIESPRGAVQLSGKDGVQLPTGTPFTWTTVAGVSPVRLTGNDDGTLVVLSKKVQLGEDPGNYVQTDGTDIHLAAAGSLVLDAGKFVKVPDDVMLQIGDVPSTGLIAHDGSLKFTVVGGLDVDVGGTGSISTDCLDLNVQQVNVPLDSRIRFGEVTEIGAREGKDGETGGRFEILSDVSVTISSKDSLQLSTGTLALDASQKVTVPAGTTLELGKTSVIYHSTVDDALHLSNPVSVIVDRDMVINGSLVVSGAATEIVTTKTTLHDPIITLGSGTTVEHIKDRGVEFIYGNNSRGFMGYSQQDQRFYMIKDGENHDEVFTKTNFGDLQVAKLFADMVVSSNGFGAGSVTGTPNLKLDADNIEVAITGNFSLPFWRPIVFGDDRNKIFGTPDDLRLQSPVVSVPNGNLRVGTASLVSERGTLRIEEASLQVTTALKFSGEDIGTQVEIRREGDQLLLDGKVVQIVSGNLILGNANSTAPVTIISDENGNLSLNALEVILPNIIKFSSDSGSLVSVVEPEGVTSELLLDFERVSFTHESGKTSLTQRNEDLLLTGKLVTFEADITLGANNTLSWNSAALTVRPSPLDGGLQIDPGVLHLAGTRLEAVDDGGLRLDGGTLELGSGTAHLTASHETGDLQISVSEGNQINLTSPVSIGNTTLTSNSDLGLGFSTLLQMNTGLLVRDTLFLAGESLLVGEIPKVSLQVQQGDVLSLVANGGVNIQSGNLSVGEAKFVSQGDSLHLDADNIHLDGEVHVSRDSLIFSDGKMSSLTYSKNEEALILAAGKQVRIDSELRLGGALFNWVEETGTLTIGGEEDSNFSLCLKGKLKCADWEGSTVGTAFGGTGSSGPWEEGAVVYVGGEGKVLTARAADLSFDGGTGSLSVLSTINVGNEIRFKDNWELSTSSPGEGSDAIYLGSGLGSRSGLLVVRNENGSSTVTIGGPGSLAINSSDKTGLILDGDFRLVSLNPSVFFTESTSIGVKGDNILLIRAAQWLEVDTKAKFHDEAIFRNDVILTSEVTASTARLSVSVETGLRLTSLNMISLGAPHVLIQERLCWSHHHDTGDCRAYEHLTMTGDIEMVNQDGNIILQPKESVTLPDYKHLVIGSSGYLTSAGSTELQIVSPSGNILLNPLERIKIPMDRYLDFGHGTVTLMQPSTGGSFNFTSVVDLSLNVPRMNLPDNTPLVFGDFGRRIVSDGEKLYIYGGESLVFESPTVRVTGRLIVNSATTFTTGNETHFDSGIIVLGGEQSSDVIHIELTSGESRGVLITTAAPHGLKVGDNVRLEGTSPDVDGSYEVQDVPSTTTFTVTPRSNLNSAQVLAATDFEGTVRSKLTVDSGQDLGIQINWHTGDSEGARTAFFGFDRSTKRWTFIDDSVRVNGTFTGTPGNIDVGTVFARVLHVPELASSLFTNGFLVSGTNFEIGGGLINNTPIGNVTPSSGSFSNLHVVESFTVGNGAVVSNLNADKLDGFDSSAFIFRNGSTALTADWSAGDFRVTSRDIAATSLTTGYLVTADAQGTLLSTKDENSRYLVNGTLDLTSGNLLVKDGSFPVEKLTGGLANINISGNASTVTNGVYRHDFSPDHSLLVADVSGEPRSLQLGVNTILGRVNGDVQAIGRSDVINMWQLLSETTYTAHSILKADEAGKPVALTVPENSLIGRANGDIIALSKDDFLNLWDLNFVEPKWFTEHSILKADVAGEPYTMYMPKTTILGRDDGNIMPLGKDDVIEMWGMLTETSYSDFYTILRADAAGVPDALHVPEKTVVGRNREGIVALQLSDVREMWGLLTDSLFSQHTILKADEDANPTQLFVPPATFIGRGYQEGIRALSLSEVLTMLDVVQRGHYERHSLLKADEKGLPEPLYLPPNSLLGRQDAGIVAMTREDIVATFHLMKSEILTDHTILKADVTGEPIAMYVPENTLVGRTAGHVIQALSADTVKDILDVETMTPEVIYRNGGLMRDGHVTFPLGATMTGLLFVSCERYTLITGQIREADVNKDTSYISVERNRNSGSRVAQVNLGRGLADGHRKVVMASHTAPGCVIRLNLTVTCPDEGLVGCFVMTSGQSVVLQWDSVLNSWFVVGSGAPNLTIDELEDENWVDEFAGLD